MKIKITHEVELQPFMTPNFIITVMAPGSRGEGILEAPKIPLADADEATLDRLCSRFREDIFKKAGKTDPRLK